MHEQDENEEGMDGAFLNRRYRSTKVTYRSKPDYTTPPFHFSEEQRERIGKRLAFLYGEEEAEMWLPEIERICRVHYAYKKPEMIRNEAVMDPLERFTEEDVILITYGDLIQGKDRSPLTTLSKFCGLQLQRCINTLHILPFFPYSSDRGFAVIDFDNVDPHLGRWSDIEDLETRYHLMFDGVINHVSSQSRWFQEFLNCHPHYRDYFISFRTPDELPPKHRNLIFRPRASDILSPFPTLEGIRYVWTTFSNDQVDLNYRNPEVLIRVIDVLLNYVRRGADLLRLDAVTYLWRRAGTSCIHLPETHETVKLIRDVLEIVAAQVALVTETNVPHEENIAYFGNGHDEAHLIYNFALPPLLLHTFYTGDATRLAHWARTLEPPSPATGFLNFLDSHDGMGLLAIRDILTTAETQALLERAQSHGGLVSYRTEPDTSYTPYEINITWFSALNREGSNEDLGLQIDRFLASRAIAVSLRGVPGIYLHSLFGTRNDQEAVMRSGVKRDINRRTVDYDSILAAMADPATSISRIMERTIHLLRIRTRERCFHPRGPQRILEIDPQFFGVERRTPENDRVVLAVTNIADRPGDAIVTLDQESSTYTWMDLLSRQRFTAQNHHLRIPLPPYGYVWLTPREET